MDASPSPPVGSGPDSVDSPMDTDDPNPPIPAGAVPINCIAQRFDCVQLRDPFLSGYARWL